ncbi:MAG: hypothetical protein DMF97_01660, partial [Acidobacteria bacterium]
MLVGPHGFCHTRHFDPTLEKTSRPNAEVAAFAFLGGVAWSDTLAAREDSRMAEEIVRDQTGRKIGTLETRADGILVAKDL